MWIKRITLHGYCVNDLNDCWPPTKGRTANCFDTKFSKRNESFDLTRASCHLGNQPASSLLSVMAVISPTSAASLKEKWSVLTTEKQLNLLYGLYFWYLLQESLAEYVVHLFCIVPSFNGFRLYTFNLVFVSFFSVSRLRFQKRAILHISLVFFFEVLTVKPTIKE